MNTIDKITKKDLHTIAKGACIMASGGGGSYEITKYQIDKYFTDKDTVSVISPLDLKNDDWFACAACMFPPSAMTRDTDMITPVSNVLKSMENWCKVNSSDLEQFRDFKKFNYFHPLEIGASNTVLPIIALSKLNKELNKNIKIIDADTAGRSIPTLPLIVFAAYQKNKNISWFPNYVTSKTMDEESYYSGQFNLPDGSSLEDAFITLIMDQFDKCGGFSVFPMKGKTLHKHPSVYGTLNAAFQVGQIFEIEGMSREEKGNKIAEYFTNNGRKSKIIFKGTVSSINLEQGGTDNENIIINGIEDDEGNILELMVSNENIFAYKYKKGDLEKKIYILGPDSMCFIPLDEKIDAVDNSDLLNYFNCPNIKDIKVAILGITAPEVVYDIVTKNKNNILLENWSKEWSMLGYEGKKYIQPWLN